MRLIVFGCGSFIARHVIASAQKAGIETVALRHGDEMARDFLCPTDTVINFALAPELRVGPYREDLDLDTRIAGMTRRKGARFAMLSTRRVYPAPLRWNASETGWTEGDETQYGQNRARTERHVADETNGTAAIFRLSNVFGMEYDAHLSRQSFLGQLLRSLKRENIIRFDMHPDTRRDFIPVERCADALVTAVAAGAEGVYNIGAGFPVRCGDLAAWICEGFGGGSLAVSLPLVRDEFFLNIDRWSGRFPRPVGPEDLRIYCVGLGQRLKRA